MNEHDKFREKHDDEVFLARGMVLELSTLMERRFNEILLKIGKIEIPYHFIIKAKIVEDLMLKLTPEIEREKFKTFQDFVRLRNIFAHAPIKWYFHERLEFESGGQYKKFFETNPEWKNFDYAINYFKAISGKAIILIENFITHFNINKQMKIEIDKAVWGFEMPPKMREKIYKIGDELERDMEEKREALRGERKGDEFD